MTSHGALLRSSIAERCRRRGSLVPDRVRGGSRGFCGCSEGHRQRRARLRWPLNIGEYGGSRTGT